MKADSFNVKVHDEAMCEAKISLAASCGNTDYDKEIGWLNTQTRLVKFYGKVPIEYLSRIAAAIDLYLGGCE